MRCAVSGSCAEPEARVGARAPATDRGKAFVGVILIDLVMVLVVLMVRVLIGDGRACVMLQSVGGVGKC